MTNEKETLSAQIDPAIKQKIHAPSEKFKDQLNNPVVQKHIKELGSGMVRVGNYYLYFNNGSLRAVDIRSRNNNAAIYSSTIILDRFVSETYWRETNDDEIPVHPHIEYHYNSGGILGAEEKPSIIKRNEDGSIYEEEYWINGARKLVATSLDDSNIVKTMLEINGKPAEILIQTSKKDNSVIKEEVKVDGKYHSIGNSPAIKTKFASEWYKDGMVHREDGPAIEHIDGSKYWYKEGVYHRKSGPAVEQADGREEWLKEGKHHREDGPAIITSHGEKFWYQDGKFHREIDPAIEYIDGRKMWYKEGKFLREEWFNKEGKLHREDGPAIKRVDGTSEWYKEGQLHRENGPAVFSSIGNKFWYKEGKLHRGNGPAIEYTDGRKLWYKEGAFVREERYSEKGQLHKEDGPAVIYNDGTREWYKEGKRHREDGPAVIFDNGDKIWYKEGKYHRDYGPAMEYVNGRKDWYKEGNRHRENGPAVEFSNGNKSWFKENKLHRSNGPAVENISGYKAWYINSSLSREEWLKEGKFHREDGPAIVNANGDKSWYKDGVLHREDGPAVEYNTGDTFWYKEGKRHRLDGPAVVYIDDEEERYYIDDKNYSKQDYDNKIRAMYPDKPEVDMVSVSPQLREALLEGQKLEKLSEPLDSALKDIIDMIDALKTKPDLAAANLRIKALDVEKTLKELKKEKENLLGSVNKSTAFLKGLIEGWAEDVTESIKITEGLKLKLIKYAKEEVEESKMMQGKIKKTGSGGDVILKAGTIKDGDAVTAEAINHNINESVIKQQASVVENAFKKNPLPSAVVNAFKEIPFKESKGEENQQEIQQQLIKEDVKQKLIDSFEQRIKSMAMKAMKEDKKDKENKDSKEEIRINNFVDRVETSNTDNQLHSFDGGSAVKYKNGRNDWYKNGKRHRLNGPAVEYSSGLYEYYIDGAKRSKEDYEDIKSFYSLMEDVKTAFESVLDPVEDFFTKYKVERVGNKDIHYLDNNKIKEDTFDEDGLIKKITCFDEDGNIHSPKPGLPAEVIFNEDESFSNYYLSHGKYTDGIYRSDHYKSGGVKRVEIREGGEFSEQHFYDENGEIIRFVKIDPKTKLITLDADYNKTHASMNVFYENGIIKQQFRINKDLQLDGENCLRLFTEDGFIKEVSSFKDGQPHCYNGQPSVTEFFNDKDDVVKRVDSCIEGSDYLTNIPSVIEYGENKIVICKSYTDKDGSVLREIKTDKDLTITEYANGDKEWRKEGKFHRLDGPAIERANGLTLWYKEGKYHREDGPAVVCVNGEKRWFKEGIEYSEKTQSKLKTEAYSAGYRIAANQVSKGVKGSILALMQKNGMENSKLKHLEDVLESEFGTALISASIGYMLSMDKFADSPKATKLAREFRVEGMAMAGNAVIDDVIKYILPSIIKETETMKYRVEESIKQPELMEVSTDQMEETAANL